MRGLSGIRSLVFYIVIGKVGLVVVGLAIALLMSEVEANLSVIPFSEEEIASYKEFLPGLGSALAFFTVAGLVATGLVITIREGLQRKAEQEIGKKGSDWNRK